LTVLGLGNWNWEAELGEGEGDRENERGSGDRGLRVEELGCGERVGEVFAKVVKLISEEGVPVEREFIPSPKRSSE
jgi:hypothetical protein